MYRAIKLNKYKFSDIQITERLSVLQKEICNALQISLRSTRNLQCISFLAIKIECYDSPKNKNKTHMEKQ